MDHSFIGYVCVYTFLCGIVAEGKISQIHTQNPTETIYMRIGASLGYRQLEFIAILVLPTVFWLGQQTKCCKPSNYSSEFPHYYFRPNYIIQHKFCLIIAKQLTHGSRGSNSAALDTKSSNFFDISLFTIATKPSNSELQPVGSRQFSINPMQLKKFRNI